MDAARPSTSIAVGCKISAKKTIENVETLLEAEVLAVRTAKTGGIEYYVHYVDFNKRLDEWIPATAVDLQAPIEPPKPAKKRGFAAQQSANAAAATKQSSASEGKAIAGPGRRRLTPKKDLNDGLCLAAAAPRIVVSDAEDGADGARDAIAEIAQFNAAYEKMSLAPSEFVSRDAELETLRRGGSMTQRQEEIARVRNISQIEMGRFRVNTWYFSPYPEEICDDQGTVYICEFCLGYAADRTSLARHLAKCTLRHPPGHEIYRKETHSFFEVDGKKQKTYCRNLCLLSKLFLDHKTLYYDVEPFLFYVLTANDAYGCKILGYFSKEKESADNYNLACILTLPQHQRKGYGKLLIAFSYELAKRTGQIGSPEKPLSDLGLISYRSYWAEEIFKIIATCHDEVSIEDISAVTCITCEDILHTLQALDLLCYFRGQHILLLTEKVLADFDKTVSVSRNKLRIDPTAIVWTPKTFSNQLHARF